MDKHGAHPDGPRMARLSSLMRVLDLTDLKGAPDFSVAAFCGQALTPLGCVAAVCLLPDQVARAKYFFQNSGIAVATVVNFPEPGLSVTQAVAAIEEAVASGADEIDVVLPYPAVQSGEMHSAMTFLKSCREACGASVCMKVILETGALQKPALIDAAASLALDAGTDFLKTSTGVGYPGADVAAVRRMLHCIDAHGGGVGIKVSGGIRTVAQAMQLTQAVIDAWGDDAVVPGRYRIGASALRAALLDAALTSDVS